MYRSRRKSGAWKSLSRLTSTIELAQHLLVSLQCLLWHVLMVEHHWEPSTTRYHYFLHNPSRSPGIFFHFVIMHVCLFHHCPAPLIYYGISKNNNDSAQFTEAFCNARFVQLTTLNEPSYCSHMGHINLCPHNFPLNKLNGLNWSVQEYKNVLLIYVFFLVVQCGQHKNVCGDSGGRKGAPPTLFQKAVQPSSPGWTSQFKKRNM